jgi:hypothetical protein
MTLEDLTRYAGGELANRFYNSRESRDHTKGALQYLASELEIEEKAKGFIDGAMASREGMKTAAEVYSSKYKEALESTSILDLKNHYDSNISEYLDEEKAEIVRNEFNLFSNETFGDIAGKIRKAEYVLNGEDNGYGFSEIEKKKAREDIEKYGRIATIISYLENIKFENLRGEAVKRTHKTDFKDLIEKLYP